jgi:hypothetical protein
MAAVALRANQAFCLCASRSATALHGSRSASADGDRRWRIQSVVATLSCWHDRRYSFSASAGVFQPSVLRRAAVQRRGDGNEVLGGVSGEVGALREVLAKEAVGVLVGPTLPGTVRVTEVHVQAGVNPELGVL